MLMDARRQGLSSGAGAVMLRRAEWYRSAVRELVGAGGSIIFPYGGGRLGRFQCPPLSLGRSIGQPASSLQGPGRATRALKRGKQWREAAGAWQRPLEMVYRRLLPTKQSALHKMHAIPIFSFSGGHWPLKGGLDLPLVQCFFLINRPLTAARITSIQNRSVMLPP